jgi:chromosome condensin MukBEF ATPase and DNA-binding subunit MukB
VTERLTNPEATDHASVIRRGLVRYDPDGSRYVNALAALDALLAERDAAVSVAAEYLESSDANFDRAEAAEATLTRMEAERNEWQQETRRQADRALRAEATLTRYRNALEQIAHDCDKLLSADIPASTLGQRFGSIAWAALDGPKEEQ